ncbi:hypothetical protein P8452_34158 [Trifolium repens]|nr:hypothetical protein P8452_34158 [Trifolium repens]
MDLADTNADGGLGKRVPHVRHQTGSYGKDILEHHQHRPKDKIDAWKDALNQVAGLSGWDSQKTRHESTLVIEIVEDISKKLNRCVSKQGKGNRCNPVYIPKHG